MNFFSDQFRDLSLYLGIAPPGFEWLMVCPVTEGQLQDVRTFDGSPAGFQAAHRIMKARGGGRVAA